MNREQKFSLLNEQEECKVEKALVKNLILGYFSAPSRKKDEVLKLIANILEFSQSELQQVTNPFTCYVHKSCHFFTLIEIPHLLLYLS